MVWRCRFSSVEISKDEGIEVAFRFKGKNHAGQEWRAAGAIVTFGKQIEELRPKGHKSDGTVAGKDHDKASPTSDHRPHPRTGLGVVRAIDFGETEHGLVDEVGEALRLSKDPRIAYFIHDGRIFSSTPTKKKFKAWEWRPYTGSSPHRDHGHLSDVTDALSEQTHPFSISLTQPIGLSRIETNPEGEDDMWQFLTVNEELVRHAFAQGWLQPKTEKTLDFFLDAVKSGEINDPDFGDFRNFRVAVTNGVVLSAKSS